MRPLSPINAPGVTGSVARVSTLRAAGVPKWRLYAEDVPRVLHGVAVVPGLDPESLAVRVSALHVLMRPGRFISRRTAAELYEIPLIRSGGPLSVGAIRPQRPPKHREIAGHQLRPGALSELPGAPSWLPRPADVWGLLAACSSPDELVVAGDFLVSGASRYEAPLCRLQELESTVQRFEGCTGVAALRTALPLLRTGVESPSETLLRLRITAAGLPEPRTCCPVPVLGRVLHADLGYPELRIAIDYDGEYHFDSGVEQRRRDNARREAMRDAGWTVLVVTAIDLRDPREFLARLANAIARARAAMV